MDWKAMKYAIETSSRQLTETEQSLAVKLMVTADMIGIDELIVSIESPGTERQPCQSPSPTPPSPPQGAPQPAPKSGLSKGDKLATIMAIVALIGGAIIQVFFDVIRDLFPNLIVIRLVMLSILFILAAMPVRVMCRYLWSLPDE